MNFIAIKMLLGDRAKYIGIIIGLTFASFLVTWPSAIFTGVMSRTFSFVTDVGLPDIWVVGPTSIINLRLRKRPRLRSDHYLDTWADRSRTCLIGSIAEKVVRHAPCSVLVVPSHPKVRMATLAKASGRKTRTLPRSPRRIHPVADQRQPRKSPRDKAFTRKDRKLAAQAFPRTAENKQISRIAFQAMRQALLSDDPDQCPDDSSLQRAVNKKRRAFSNSR
jgi:hypothetical protein